MCVFSGGQVGGISIFFFFFIFLVVFIFFSLTKELSKSTLTVKLSPGARFSKAGRTIAPNTGANATKFFTLATKS